MKKNLLNSILAVLAVMLFSMNIFATPVQPVRMMTVNCADDDYTVMDGIADYSYGEIQTTHIFNPTGYDGELDFTATFQVCFDQNYLYVLAEITDDVNHSYQWGVGNSWEFDNFEIFLQLDTNTVTTDYGATTVQLRVCRGLDSVETAGRAARSDYLYYMDGSAPGGWIAEVAVPWTAVLADSAVPEDMCDYFDSVIGFEFGAADSDNTDSDPDVGNRDVQAAWDEDGPSDEDDRTEDMAWNNTSVFGYVSLANEYNCPGEGINNSFQEIEIQTFPNPAGESIHLMNIDQPCSLTIYNMQGAVVLVTEYLPDQELDISGLKSGMYTFVLDGNKSGRFIKK